LRLKFLQDIHELIEGHRGGHSSMDWLQKL
jgi:hypothetical protein